MGDHLQRAFLLFEQSRYDLAEQELRQSLAETPDEAAAHTLLALCLAHREAFDEATREAKRGIELAPDLPFGFYAIGCIYRDRNRFDEAATAAEEAIRLDPEDADYHGLLASVRLAQSRWQDALASAETGLESEPEHVGCTNLRAIALVKLGRRAEAGATIDAALARDPDNSVTHANQGWTLLDRGDAKRALEHFRESLRLDPTNDWARHGIVEALKARNVVYALMLRYFLWMAKLSGGARWAVILGGYFLYRALSSVAAANPTIAPYIRPLIIAYTIFALMTWLSSPFFNLLLRLNRFGRYALSREQTVASNWFGACLLLALASLGVWLLAPGPWSGFGLLGAVVFGPLLIPLTAVFACDAGWPRWAMAAYTVLLLMIVAGGMAMVVLGPPSQAAGVVTGTISLFLGGVFLSQFVAMGLSSVTVRK
jgi:tetratricopeptide (TPR) repeat protein